MDLKHCRICDAPGAYEDGGQSIEEHIAVGSTDPWCECECCGNTERYHDWQDSEPLDSPLRRQLAAANEITINDVVAYLGNYGWALVRAPLPSAHWAPAAPGSAPIAYYLWELRGAIADTSLRFYLPDVAGAITMRVRAVDENDVMGEWSDVGKSSGGALPGVGF